MTKIIRNNVWYASKSSVDSSALATRGFRHHSRMRRQKGKIDSLIMLTERLCLHLVQMEQTVGGFFLRAAYQLARVHLFGWVGNPWYACAVMFKISENSVEYLSSSNPSLLKRRTALILKRKSSELMKWRKWFTFLNVQIYAHRL